MTRRIKWFFLIFLALLPLALALQSGYRLWARAGSESDGTILVWHSWPDPETAVLEEIVDRFAELNPDSRIILSRLDEDLLLTRFLEAAETGFGPDLLIGPSRWSGELVDAELIQPLDDWIDESFEQSFLPGSLDVLRHEGQLYGIPESLSIQALYFRSDTEAPPSTLDALVSIAENGAEVGLTTNFEDAFWGIAAFGGRLFDEEGRVILDQGGYANWLNWLKNAQESPDFLLSTDGTSLQTLFIEGELDYLVERSDLLSTFLARLDPEEFSVAPLPAGPTSAAGSLLEVEALMISSASSAESSDLAIRLATFLTRSEQQTVLMRAAAHVPANARVNVNPRLDPAIAAFLSSARSAVSIPRDEVADTLFSRGDETHARALAGLVSPVEAAETLTRFVNELNGFPAEVSEGFRCNTVGSLTLWHATDLFSPALTESLVDHFRATCPNILLTWEVVPSSIVADRLSSATEGTQPDLIVVANSTLPNLVQNSLVAPFELNDESTLLQRFMPQALTSMMNSGALYALPMAVESQALLYQPGRVDQPAESLDSLLEAIQSGQKLGLATDFVSTFWGIPAFGGDIIDAEGNLELDIESFTDWLTWFESALDGGAEVAPSLPSLRQKFREGEIVYLVDSLDGVREMEAALGAQSVRAAPLPTGPDARSASLARSIGFALGPNRSEERRSTALEFLDFATRTDVQMALLETRLFIPANGSVDVSAYPILESFIEGLENVHFYPNQPGMNRLAEFGSDAYVWVSADVLEPAAAAAEANTLVLKTLGTSTSDEVTFDCSGEGEVFLWHSWTETIRASALESAIAEFSALCPAIGVVPFALAADDLKARLLTGEIGGVVIAPAQWSLDLSESGALPPLEAGSSDQARQALPDAVAALTIDGDLYGFPLTVDLYGLYMNRSRGATPVDHVDGLLNEALAGRRVGIGNRPVDLFWGLSAFIPSDVSSESGAAEAAERNGLIGWLSWLQEARATPGLLIEEPDQMEALFTNGRLAYYIGSSSRLGAIQEVLNGDRLAIAPLPAGPAGQPAPRLTTTALFLPAANEDESAASDSATTLARYLTGVPGGTTLAREGGLIPANRLVDLEDLPAVASFQTRAASGTGLGSDSPLANPDGQVGTVYEQVLEGSLSPSAAVERYYRNGQEE